jgi:drug/metabolite transporter (DMT)-like permease
MAVILGLLVSVAYGCGDFFGGLAAKRTRVTAVVVGSFALSTALLAVVTATWWAMGTLPSPGARDVGLGVAVGLVGPAALGLLYHGLAVGRMSVVAPITAVLAAVIPFAWGVASGERPGPVAVGGVLLALLAVAVISGAPEHSATPAIPDHAPGAPPARGDRAVVAVSIGSGIGFGVVYVLLGSTTPDAALWPLAAARPTSVLASAAVLGVIARRQRTPLRSLLVPSRSAALLVAGAGVLDVSANAMFLAATNRGLLSIVSVLSSLYPAATVLLARFVLDERLHRQQVGGLALAVVGVVAMAAG